MIRSVWLFLYDIIKILTIYFMNFNEILKVILDVQRLYILINSFKMATIAEQSKTHKMTIIK